MMFWEERRGTKPRDEGKQDGVEKIEEGGANQTMSREEWLGISIPFIYDPASGDGCRKIQLYIFCEIFQNLE